MKLVAIKLIFLDFWYFTAWLFKKSWHDAGWWLQQKHIPLINNIVAHSKSVFNGQVIANNQIRYGEKENALDFTSVTRLLHSICLKV